MQFLNPSILWALSALSIPIFIHLFNFRRAKLVKFSNVRFLEQVRKKNSSKKRLKHLLILLTRMLFLSFLILAFAQPYLPALNDGLDGNRVTIFIDNSLSMSNTSSADNESLTTAINMAENIINHYPEHVKFRLISHDAVIGTDIFRSKQYVLDEILELNYSDISRPIESISNRISNDNLDQDIFIISDFQESNFNALEWSPDTTRDYHIIPIIQTSTRNVSVDSIYLRSPYFIKGQRNELIATIMNNDNTNRDDLIVKLHINEREVSSVSVDLDNQETKEIHFELNNISGNSLGRISFDDYPVRFDNAAYFTLNTQQTIQVVEIKSKDESTAFDVLFGSNELYKFNSFRQGSLRLNLIENAHLLIINSLPSLDQSLVRIIADFIEQGKSVVFIPSSDGEYLNISETLKLGLKKYEYTDTLEFNVADWANPFYRNVFEEIDNNTAHPTGQFVWKWSSRGQTLLKSRSDKPFLSRFTNQGQLYLAAGELSAPYSTFHRNALFVPVFLRISELSTSASQALYYTLDQTYLEQTLDTVGIDGIYKLVADEKEIVPDQRVVGNQLIFNIPTEQIDIGHYDLIQDEMHISTLAFNPSKKESNLKQLSGEEINKLFAKVQNKEIYSIDEPTEITDALKALYDKVELWKFALLLSLLCLLIEALLIRFL